MADNELLLAISEMMDKKLDARLKPMEDSLQTVKEDLQSVKEEVQTVKEEVQTMKEDLQSVKEEVQTVKEDLQSVKDEMHQMKLYQENVIMPRLQNIESCYTDTFRRYQSGVGQIETMQIDIDAMKSVIREHSDKLQKIS